MIVPDPGPAAAAIAPTTMRTPLSRRTALRAFAAGALTASIPSCARRTRSPRVVLYSSVDDHLLRELVPLYEAATGVGIDLVGDTEATKSAGLAERVIAERARPRADVWWSSEPFFTIRLAREGLLEPGAAREALGQGVASVWPEGLLAGDGSWAGFACRARVIVSRTSRVPASEVPTRLDALTDPRWRGRVAMARPEFGTTRGHLAALIEHNGPEATEAWLRAMKANGLRVYSGNSTVVRAVAQGEVDLALTDTDDVWSGQRNGWDVEASFEADDGAAPPAAPGAADRGSARPVPTDGAVDPGRGAQSGDQGPRNGDQRIASLGPLVLPNTAGLVRAGPNAAQGRRLLAWILGGQAERVLAQSESRNMPVHPDVAGEFPDLAMGAAWRPDLERVADHLDAAAEMAARVLDG